MAKRIIQSPGVEIQEVDLSLRVPSPTGTTIYTTGFADQGPTDEVISISSLNEFVRIYGTPKTPAERYFYQTVKASLDSESKLFVNRLPYGSGDGEGFGYSIGVLAYPAMAVPTTTNGLSSTTMTTLTSSDGLTYFLGKPTQFNITPDEHRKIMNGEAFTWASAALSTFGGLSDLGGAAIIIVNKAQTIVDGKYNGYYIGLADNTGIDPGSNYDSIRNIYTVSQTAPSGGISDFNTVPSSRMDFALTATPAYGDNPKTDSISQIMEEKITGFDIADPFFDDTLNLGVFKLRQSIYGTDANTLGYTLEEGFNGSIGYYRQTTSSKGGLPINFFLENIENDSRNIEILVNPNISNQLVGLQLNEDGTPKNKIRILSEQAYNTLPTLSSSFSAVDLGIGCSRQQYTYMLDTISYSDALFPIGAYGETKATQKTSGNVPTKLSRALDGIRNSDVYDIDIIAEGGLGTIWTCGSAGFFDDTKSTKSVEDLRGGIAINGEAQDALDAYNSIFTRFVTFAGPTKDGGRGDVLFIADPIRQILVTGKDNKVINNPLYNFTQHIYWPLRHQFSIANTSYACAYANYLKVYDDYSGLYMYAPPSGFVAAKLVATDSLVGPWGAAAGFNRGILTNAIDVALVPNQRQRDDLYNISLNPITTFPDQGIVVYGQKTLLKKPSAFDRINVRRNFLYLEKATKSVMKFFVFENNTLFTRTQILNTLTPFFERVKQADGLYDYLIVCDERNNTPEVIDNNELIVDIYLKPVRTAEFIRVNFYATRTDANFEELIGG